MKISVCIPIYNFDVRQLVYDLLKEIQDYTINAEIILVDDGSNEDFRLLNNELSEKVNQFIILEKNIGRSRVRNLFLDHTEGEFLLFLDCDVAVQPLFLTTYINTIAKNSEVEVFYGNFKIDPAFDYTLRNRYSVRKEIFYGDRSTDFSLLKTVNFVIKKTVFKKYKFDESLQFYGYEDFVFAKTLEIAKIKFLVINNPVVHIDTSSNELFLHKTEIGINSLFTLSQNPEKELYVRDVKVLKLAKALRATFCDLLFLQLYNAFEKNIVSNLKGKRPNILLYDLFKLAVLLKKFKYTK